MREVRPPAAHRGSAIAMLSIPRVHLSAAVLHGSDTKTLRRGPGHLEDTAFPGDAGNVVIAGHRDSYFRPLRNIKIGDDIFLDTPQGRFQYRVESTRVVDPRDLSVLARTDEDVLTLITCYPFSVLGNAPDRFIVRAAAVVNSAVASPAGNPSPLPSLDLSAPYESTVVPPPYEAAATRAVIRETDAVRDDDSLVRLAVERFRLTYNGRLVSRRDVRPLAPLRFETCRVDVTDDRATATCAVVEPSDDALRVRTFMLERVDGGWAIRTIVAN